MCFQFVSVDIRPPFITNLQCNFHLFRTRIAFVRCLRFYRNFFVTRKYIEKQTQISTAL